MQFSNFAYLIINIIVFLAPLVGVLYKKVPGLKEFFINYLKTFSIVGVLFIIWDSLVTSRGDWSFSSIYTLGIKAGNIPVEEALFFFTIPFASLALYELINIVFKDKKLVLDRSVFAFLVVTFLIISLIFGSLIYTSNMLLFCAVLFLVPIYFKNTIFATKNFYTFMLIAFIPFIIVNWILTSLPIVTYNAAAITGIRIGTIPVEDFFYSLFMLSTYLVVYYIFKNRNGK